MNHQDVTAPGNHEGAQRALVGAASWRRFFSVHPRHPRFLCSVVLVLSALVSRAAAEDYDIEGDHLRKGERVIHYYKCRVRSAHDIKQVLDQYAPALDNTQIVALDDPYDAINPGAIHWDINRGSGFHGNQPRPTRLRIDTLPKHWPFLVSLLERFDVPRRSVKIQVIVQELSSSRDFQLGFEGAFKKPTANTDNFWRGSSVSFNPDDWLTAQVKGTLPFQGVQLGFTTEGTNSLEDIGLATLDLRATQHEQRTEVKSEPEVVVEEGDEVIISSTRMVPFVNTTVAGNQSSSDVQFKPAGVHMWVRAQLVGSDSVLLDVRVRVDVETANTVKSSFGVQNPILSSRSAWSTFHLKDQSWLIFGGLKGSTVLVDSAGVPLLSDIPVLGWLFRKHRRFQRDSLIYFQLKPTIQPSFVGSERGAAIVTERGLATSPSPGTPGAATPSNPR